jgi:hypothetical protein
MNSICKQQKFLSDGSFIQIKNTLENFMKSRARNHVNNPKHRAQIITLEEEDILWPKEVLESDNKNNLLLLCYI